MKSEFKLLLIATLLFGNLSTAIAAKKKYQNQPKPNLTTGYDIKLSDNYAGRNFHIGIAVTDKFEKKSHAYWKVGADLNWNKYSVDNYEPFQNNYHSVVNTNSFSIPIEFGYQINKSILSRTYIFAGPVYDYIINARMNGLEFDNFDRGLWGFNLGLKFRVIKLFDLKISYSTFPEYNLNNGGFNRSSLNLSIGM